MGAIYGVFGESDARELDAMGSRLAHRGLLSRVWTPAEGVWFGIRVADVASDEACYGGPINFHGAIENRTDIAALCGLSHPDRVSDASLLLELYHRFGPDGLGHVSGQFAMALWDAAARCLILARDAWSICPLYLSRTGDRYLFASEYKALLAVDAVPTSPDREAIQHMQRTRYLPRQATCLAAIRPVPGGTWLVLGRDGGRSGDYRRLAVDIRARSRREHAIRLRAALVTAARRQTGHHDRIGVALSTGVDSAIALAAARQAAPHKEIHSFTARFMPDDQDLEAAAGLARRFGSLHHEVDLKTANLPELLPRTLYHMEDPVGGEEFVCFAAVAREAARHVTLLLTGHQSDVLFGGMPRHHLLDLAARLPLLAKPLMELLNYTQSGIAARSALGRALVAWSGKGMQLEPPRVIGIVGEASGIDIDLHGAEPLTRYMCNRLLGRGDGFAAIERVHAAVGLPMTSPFFDSDVVRCAFQIPDRLKIRCGRQKQILRDAGRGLVPDKFLDRRKMLIRLDHGRELADVLEELADELLGDAAVRARGLIEPAYVARLRQHLSAGTCVAARLGRLWSLLLLELWCRIFVDRRGASAIDTSGMHSQLPPSQPRAA
jgi:asparagine synthase (glutamine-hydrolysing)